MKIVKRTARKKMRIALLGIVLGCICLFAAACDLGLNDALNFKLLPDQKEDQDAMGYLMDKLLEENKESIIDAFEDTFKDELQRILSEQGNEVLSDEKVLDEIRQNLLNDPTLRKEVQKAIMEDPEFQQGLIDGLSDNDEFMEKLLASDEFQAYLDGLIQDAVEDAMKDYNPLPPS